MGDVIVNDEKMGYLLAIFILLFINYLAWFKDLGKAYVDMFDKYSHLPLFSFPSKRTSELMFKISMLILLLLFIFVFIAR